VLLISCFGIVNLDRVTESGEPPRCSKKNTKNRSTFSSQADFGGQADQVVPDSASGRLAAEFWSALVTQSLG
jgi:hypothetical protein